MILLPQLSEELGNRNVALYLTQIIVLRQDFIVCSSGLKLNNIWPHPLITGVMGLCYHACLLKEGFSISVRARVCV